MYHLLADLHHWTPEQINRMDPDYIEAHIIRERARQDETESQRKREERKRARGARRRGDDVDVSEIE